MKKYVYCLAIGFLFFSSSASSQAIVEEFSVTLDSTRSIKSLLQAGKYDRIYYPSAELCSYPDTSQERVEVGILRISQFMTTEQILQNIDSLGYRPATLHELAAAGEELSDHHIMLIALGTISKYGEYPGILGSLFSVKTFSMIGTDMNQSSEWNPSWQFLVAR